MYCMDAHVLIFSRVCPILGARYMLVEAVLLSDRIVMMTNGPAAKIGEILSIDLPRPRNRLQLADDAQYNHYRAEVLRFLYEKQKKHAAA